MFTAIALTWTLRQAWAVYKLRRGVGDTWFLAADGTRWFRMDEHRRDVPLADIPLDLQHAFVAIEDHRFFHHPGVDPIALGRAVVRNLRSAGTVEGGSTLTQQLARTLFLSNRKSYGRKVREAVLAVMIDSQLSKRQILELYLNRIYLSGGVYGVETMSQHLFRRPAKSLNLAECALIAGLARAPSALSPWTNLERARARSHTVLARMREEGFITEAQERAAKAAPIRIAPSPVRPIREAATPRSSCASSSAIGSAATIRPTGMCGRRSCRICRRRANAPSRKGCGRFSEPQLQAALVAIDPANGDILALVGGRDFRLSQFNRAARSRRQPGSAFKPLVYAAALDHGFSPVSVLEGLANIRPQGPDEWAPRNARGDTPDALTLRAGLIESNNRAATALQQRLGSRPVLRLAADAGLDDLPDVPSLALGTGEVTPLNLTAAFAMFPNGGFAVRPRGIVRIVDADGGSAFDNPPRPQRVISQQSAYQMVSMLEDAITRGTGAAARGWGIRFPAGGKTGTTNDFKDAWFVGFSSSVVVGVWVGFDQPKTIGRDAYGSRYALPIWSDYMRRGLAGGRPRRSRNRRASTRNSCVSCPTWFPSRAARCTRRLQGSRRRPDAAVFRPSGYHQAACEARARRAGVGDREKDQGIFR